jgi:hypothetical protein
MNDDSIQTSDDVAHLSRLATTIMCLASLAVLSAFIVAIGF